MTRYGLIPDSPELMARYPVSFSDERRQDHTTWTELGIPIHGQGDRPSCAGHAWANAIELILAREHGKAIFGEHGQLDGEAVWKHARERFYRGDLDGGLTLRQAFLACRDIGILSPETNMRRLPRDITPCYTQLDSTPVVTGHMVWDAWYRADPTNGYIPAGPLRNGLGGHAVVLDRILLQDGESYPGGLNSWREFGWHSTYLMALGMWQASLLAAPVAPVFGGDWKGWRGWEKYIIEV